MFADKDARGVVLDAFANDDFATHIEQVKDAIDRIARGRVRQLFLSSAQPLASLQRSVLCGANEFKLDQAFEIQRAA